MVDETLSDKIFAAKTYDYIEVPDIKQTLKAVSTRLQEFEDKFTEDGFVKIPLGNWFLFKREFRDELIGEDLI